MVVVVAATAAVVVGSHLVLAPFSSSSSSAYRHFIFILLLLLQTIAIGGHWRLLWRPRSPSVKRRCFFSFSVVAVGPLELEKIRSQWQLLKPHLRLLLLLLPAASARRFIVPQSVKARSKLIFRPFLQRSPHLLLPPFLFLLLQKCKWLIT